MAINSVGLFRSKLQKISLKSAHFQREMDIEDLHLAIQERPKNPEIFPEIFLFWPVTSSKLPKKATKVAFYGNLDASPS